MVIPITRRDRGIVGRIDRAVRDKWFGRGPQRVSCGFCGRELERGKRCVSCTNDPPPRVA